MGHLRRPGSNEARSAAGLAAQLEGIAARLSGVYVENADALDVIARYAGPDALIYTDPPYLPATRTGRTRSRQGDYQHECSEDHHRALAAALHSTAAAVLVPGYSHPLYDELYAGWHRTEIRTKPSGNHSTAATRHATEVIWSNRPPGEPDALFPATIPACFDEATPGPG